MTRRSVRLCSTAVALALAACAESTSPALITDQEIETDVATTSGEAIALEVQNMIGSEMGLGFGPAGAPADSHVTVTRRRTCFDAAGNVQAQCDALTTAKVVVHVAVDDTISRDNFTAYIHRVRDDTVSGLEGTETFRVHNGVGTSNDTTRFTGERGTRTARESASDSVVNIRFNLPRSTNPWPASGSIIRNVSGTVTFTGTNETATRAFTRRVAVTFPADNQGNVTIQINDRTCNLNLVTRRVTSCS